MEQAHWGLEDHHIKEYGSQGKLTFHHLATTIEELRDLEIHQEGLLKVVSEASPLKMSWKELQPRTQKTGEFPIDFHQQTVETFSEFIGRDTGTDQIYTLVLSNFCLALSPTL